MRGLPRIYWRAGANPEAEGDDCIGRALVIQWGRVMLVIEMVRGMAG